MTTTLDRNTVLDEAIKVAQELAPVRDGVSFFEDADGRATEDVTEVRAVCASGAVRVAIHRLTGQTDYDDLRDAEKGLFGESVYELHPNIYSSARNVLREITADIPAFLTTLKEA